jgi:hypothetical protein
VHVAQAQCEVLAVEESHILAIVRHNDAVEAGRVDLGSGRTTMRA